MNISINGPLGGIVTSPASKSQAHRLLICAALAENESTIACSALNDDIICTMNCLNALGAKINYNNGIFTIIPINTPAKQATLDCGESGSTLRFMLPVAAALGVDATFTGHGRLPQRPLSPLYEQMCEHGIKMSEAGKMPLSCEGKLLAGDYEIAANISSQFISGLLFALPLTGQKCTIRLKGKIESGSYIDMTIDALKQYGITVEKNDKQYILHSGLKYVAPEKTIVEGDWSAAAFWIVAGVTGSNAITCKGLDAQNSRQGDRAIISMLQNMGAHIDVSQKDVTAYPSRLKGCIIDCHDTPDLVPALAAAAAIADGETIFNNIGRLRIKESDRVEAVCSMLRNFGITAYADENTLNVKGGKPKNGIIEPFGDHRIAMAAAILGAAVNNGSTTIINAECTNKSYPAFFDDFKSLGGTAEKTI